MPLLFPWINTPKISLALIHLKPSSCSWSSLIITTSALLLAMALTICANLFLFGKLTRALWIFQAHSVVVSSLPLVLASFIQFSCRSLCLRCLFSLLFLFLLIRLLSVCWRGGAGQHVALKLASHLPFSPRSVQPQCTHFPHPLHFTDHSVLLTL